MLPHGLEIKMSDAMNALSAPLRPGSMDVRGQQPTLFPFDAFIYDDPNRVEAPRLKMRPPWTLVSSGLEVYEDGVDEDNLLDGDRRLILEGEVLKLQHYEDPPAEWVDDISLGGYDESGNFIDFLIAKGIIRQSESYEEYSGGNRIPLLISNYKSFKDITDLKFSNLQDSQKTGETVIGGVETFLDDVGRIYKTSDGLGDRSLQVDIDTQLVEKKIIPLTQVYSLLNQSAASGAFMFRPTGGTTPDEVLVELDMNNELITFGSPTNRATTSLTIEVVTNQLVLNYSIEHYVTALTEVATGTIVLKASMDDVTEVRYAFRQNSTYATNTGTNLLRGAGLIYEIQIDEDTRLSDGIYPSPIYSTVPVGTIYDYGTSSVDHQIFLRSAKNYALSDIYIGGYVADPWNFINDSGAEYIDLIPVVNAMVNMSSTSSKFWSHYDDDNDIVIKPASAGRTVIYGGALYDEDNTLVLTGPAGEIGPDGPDGPIGPTGNYNLDGGSANSVYLPLQNIDGGTA